ncbi:hypothetical protein APLC1_2617 [Limnospira platensis C1]|nr:hypothetical protein APLC1_2617 [Arthrospira platensis C1]
MDMGWVGADLPVLSVGIEIDSRTRPYQSINYLRLGQEMGYDWAVVPIVN